MNTKTSPCSSGGCGSLTEFWILDTNSHDTSHGGRQRKDDAWELATANTACPFAAGATRAEAPTHIPPGARATRSAQVVGLFDTISGSHVLPWLETVPGWGGRSNAAMQATPTTAPWSGPEGKGAGLACRKWWLCGEA
eukprot:353543-Chlamydomonas_euryale.AAC.4